MISKAAEKQELIKRYTAHAIVPEEKKSPDDNDRTPTASFTLPSPAKMNELRLYQATYLTFYNDRTVYRDLSAPGGVVEAQEKDGTWKRIARFAGSKDACIGIKLDGETRRSLRIVFDRPRFALSEVELF